jgi:RNA polymerase sigma-70 factor (ECF subfamily)
MVHDFEMGQDISQEAFIRLFERWDRMESLDHARNFVYRVSVNLARSSMRSLRRDLSGRLFSAERGRASADESALAEDRLVLVGALNGLSGRQRACLALVDYAGLDVRTAARLLRIRASTARVHLSRGRRALALALGETYEERSTHD